MEEELRRLRETVERLEKAQYAEMVSSLMLQHVVEIALTFELAQAPNPLDVCDELSEASLRDLRESFGPEIEANGMERFRRVVEEIATHEEALWANVRRQLQSDS